MYNFHTIKHLSQINYQCFSAALSTQSKLIWPLCRARTDNETCTRYFCKLLEVNYGYVNNVPEWHNFSRFDGRSGVMLIWIWTRFRKFKVSKVQLIGLANMLFDGIKMKPSSINMRGGWYMSDLCWPMSTLPTKRSMISCHTNAINALEAYEAATNASCLYTSRLTLWYNSETFPSNSTDPFAFFRTAMVSSVGLSSSSPNLDPPQMRTPSPTNLAWTLIAESLCLSAVNFSSPIIVEWGSAALGRDPSIRFLEELLASSLSVGVGRQADSSVGIVDVAWAITRPRT